MGQPKMSKAKALALAKDPKYAPPSSNAAGPSKKPTNAAGPSKKPTNAAGPSKKPTNAAGPSKKPTNAAGPSKRKPQLLNTLLDQIATEKIVAPIGPPKCTRPKPSMTVAYRKIKPRRGCRSSYKSQPWMYMKSPPTRWTKNTITSPRSDPKLAEKYGKRWKRIWQTRMKRPIANKPSPSSSSMNNLEAQLLMNLNLNNSKKNTQKASLNNLLQNLYVPTRKATTPCKHTYIRNVDPTLNMNQLINLRTNPLYGQVTPENTNNERTRLKKKMARYLVFKNLLVKK